jgi:hypothetical protein
VVVKKPELRLTGNMPPQPGHPHISKQSLVNAVDPQIKEIIRDLLLNGFSTTSSCAGHLMPGEKPKLSIGTYIKKVKPEKEVDLYTSTSMGYIEFRKQGFNENLAKRILTKHGLTGLKKIMVKELGESYIVYLFNPIGEKWSAHYMKDGGSEGYAWEVG